MARYGRSRKVVHGFGEFTERRPF